MPVSSERPEFQHRVDDWRLVRDTVEGEAAIRRAITRYLPVPPAMNEGGVISSRYDFYKSFAEFPELISPTLNGILGLIHEKRPIVNLPTKMQYMIKTATPDGETLEEYWERLTQEILVVGRFISLAEIYNDTPYLCPYPTESLINWSLLPKRDGGGPDMVVFREVTQEPMTDDEFEYETVTRYRVIRLDGDGTYSVTVYMEAWDDNLKATIFRPVDGYENIRPSLLGREFDFLPVVVVNTLDTGFDYGPIPMLPMARRAASIFRKSADLNRSIYIKCDPQPVIMGVDSADAPSQIGGGSIWTFENAEAKVQYLDIDGQGIPIMQKAIQDDFERFSDEVGTLFEGVTSGYESGEALRRRQAMRQVTIKSLVINAAQGLVESLKMIGRVLGLSESELDTIEFTPNLDFTEPMMTGQELQNLIQARNLGAPISEEAVHALMKRRQLTNFDWETEQAKLKEVPLADRIVNPKPAGGGGVNPPPADKSSEGDK